MTAVIQRITAWNSVAQIRREGVLGLVPTMGALHNGHGALLDEARRRCSVVVASIFVNPLQFNVSSDYNLYPRLLDDDVAFCTAHAVDYIFAPLDEEMYPEPQRAFVDVEEVSQHLCGENRPGHFRGVATVVLKLFHIIQPHLAFFGEKDYQQLAVVRRLVRDMNVPAQIVGVPTVREPDGLALSSRNRRLTLKERALAPYLYKTLLAAQELIACGERNASVVKARAAGNLCPAPEIELEYLDLVDPDTIRPVEYIEGPVRAALAAWIGTTRLIDNVLCEPPVSGAEHPAKARHVDARRA
jgi:pantoate--beta-alanine ligase